MMQPAESFTRNNPTHRGSPNPGTWCFFLESKMSPVFVVIAHIVGNKSLQVLPVDRNHMVEQIAPATLDPAFGHPVLPGTLIGRLNRIDLHRSDGNWNLRAVFRVAIKDEESRTGVEREGLSQLLHDPPARRVLGDVEMQDLPSVMTDNE
jgi:hypothetical protein